MENDSKKKARSSRRVYVIGGIVAVIALSVGGWFVRGAFIRVRNRSIECCMLGEARRISSAVNQIFTETNRDEIKLGEVARYLGPDGRMSSGLFVSVDGMNFSAPYYRDVPGVLKKGGCFYVRSEFWFRSRSGMNLERPDECFVDGHTMKFDVDSGALAGTFR